MKRPTLRIALIVSVALNLLVAGAVVGALVSDNRPERRSEPRLWRGGANGPPEVGMLARGLEGQQRRELHRRLRADGGLREGLQRIRAGRSDLLDALRAQPFSAQELEAALRQQRSVQIELADRGMGVISDVIAEMSDAERAAFADRIEAASRWRQTRANRQKQETGSR